MGSAAIGHTDRGEAGLVLAVGLAFAASTLLTILLGSGMDEMPGMVMPGGWSMSQTFLRMPGQSAAEACLAFLTMWIVMMAAMMLPSLLPMLLRFRRQASRSGAQRLGRMTAVVALAYFAAWTALGAVLYGVGVATDLLTMQAPALAATVPALSGAVVVAAGLSQLTGWKARQLASCRRDRCADALVPGGALAASRHGLALGIACMRCCAGPTAALIALGVMDLRAMLAVGLAVTAERVAPRGVEVARATGIVAILVGAGMIAMTAGTLPGICSGGS